METDQVNFQTDPQSHPDERNPALPTATLTVDPKLSPVFTGESVTLKCEIESYSDWRYQWYKGSSGTAVYQSQTNTFAIRSAADQDQYWCRGERDNRPTSSQPSTTVTLTVKGIRFYTLIANKKPKPELTSSHKGAALTGNPVVLYCKLDQSAGWRFYWFRHSQSPENEIKTETHSYTISSVSVSDGGQYWCRAGRGNPVYYTHYSDALWINTTDGDVILFSPVHPVTEGDPLTLRCLYLHTTSSNLTAEFYKNGSLLQTQTTGEMTIRTVSKSDDGLYHCKNPEKGESPQSWISVRGHLENINRMSVQNRRESGAEDSQSGYTPMQAGDAADELSDVTYSQVMRKKKESKNNDADTGSMEVTYAEIELKTKKKPKKKEEEATVNTDTVYSELKQNTDEGSDGCWAQSTVQSVSHYGDSMEFRSLSVTLSLPRATLTLEAKLSPVFAGESVTLKCEIEAYSNWRYQWYKGSSRTAVSQSQTNTFTIRSAAVQDQDQYWCRGERDNRPSSSQYSNRVDLSVEEKPKPELTSSHKGAALTGNPVVLYCKLDQSAGWRFYWFRHSQSPENETRTETHSYTISSVSVSDGGQYWCRAGRGNPVYYTHYSDALWINTTDGDVILDSPVHPVTEGDPLTLHCLHRDPKPSNLTAEFYKNGSLLQIQTTGEIIIRTVSKSDEGLYHCQHPEKGESPQSWISVRRDAHVYDTVERACDTADELSDVTYSQVMRKNKKSKNNDTGTGSVEVTYAEIELKTKKKPKKKRGTAKY
ncbi:hypothetical protein AOLI_G00106370 [Acnodon oligacanthus]